MTYRDSAQQLRKPGYASAQSDQRFCSKPAISQILIFLLVAEAGHIELAISKVSKQATHLLSLINVVVINQLHLQDNFQYSS